jgi:GDP-D-mannose dehydratase
MKKALITGITGQDGAYLAELLLEKGYEVPAFASFGGQAWHQSCPTQINNSTNPQI